MEERQKDPCVFFRSVIKSTTKTKDTLNPNGHDRIQLYLDQEQTKQLVEVLTALIESPTGAKLELNIKKRVNSKNGNVFDSAYAFVKAVQEQAAQTGGPRGATKFVPKGSMTENTFSRTAKVHSELAD